MEIDSRNASRLLEDVEQIVKNLSTEEQMSLINIFNFHLRNQFDEGKNYALSQMNYKSEQLKEETASKKVTIIYKSKNHEP